MASKDGPILQPTPRRTFEFTPADPSSPEASSPERSPNPSMLDIPADSSKDGPPSRNRSIMNLTSSTLFGIYAPTGYNTQTDEPSTPWGTGAQTPLRQSIDGRFPNFSFAGSFGNARPQPVRRPSQKRAKQEISVVLVVFRSILLFLFGIAYGLLITHLHDNQRIPSVRVDGINRQHWGYLFFWGAAGLTLGSLLPYVDFLWEGDSDDASSDSGNEDETGTETVEEAEQRAVREEQNRESLGADWNPVVRSIGAFVGIAFAIVSFQVSEVTD
jgi:Insulin-induced protein (INSIG)